MKVISKYFFILNVFYFFSCGEMKNEEQLNVLFLSAGSGEPNSSHNGKINHHKLRPKFLRNNMNITYSSNLNSLSVNILSKYDAIIMYLGAPNEKPERISALINYVEAGGGLVALHNTSAAFGGDKDFVNLIGGEFDRHGSGRFKARIINGKENHPALKGVAEFEVWDETYIHKNLNEDRIDLMVRDENGRREPWVWVRNQGKGRVFYSAYGHDGRVW
ncbi:ThuA domain-containing protein, partial [bacterium]